MFLYFMKTDIFIRSCVSLPSRTMASELWILKTAEQLEELPDDISDIFQNGLIVSHGRTHNGKNKTNVFSFICSLLLQKRVEQNDSQPPQLHKCDTKDFTVTLPKVIKLESSS